MNQHVRLLLACLFYLSFYSLVPVFGQASQQGDGKGGGSGPTDGECLIAGDSRIFLDDVYPLVFSFQGNNPSNSCTEQSWTWSVSGEDLEISQGEGTPQVEVTVNSPDAHDASVNLSHCCNGNCESCNVVIEVDPPEVTDIFGPKKVDCNSVFTYTASGDGVADYISIIWTVDHPLVSVQVDEFDAIVTFGTGNYSVDLCAKACYENNCEEFEECITIVVGQESFMSWVSPASEPTPICLDESATFQASGSVGDYAWRYNGVLQPGNGSSFELTPSESGTLTAEGINACGFEETISREVLYIVEPPENLGLILNMTEGETGNPGPLTDVVTCANTTLLFKVLDVDGPTDVADWDWENLNNLPDDPALFNAVNTGDMVLQFRYSDVAQPNLTGTLLLKVQVNNICFDGLYNSSRRIQITPTGGSGIGGCGGGFKQNPNAVAGELVEEGLRLSPNPTSGPMLASYNLNTEEELSMVILNVHGKEVDRIFTDLKHDLTPYEVRFDVSKLSGGIYFCVLQTPDGKVVSQEKFLVQN